MSDTAPSTLVSSLITIAQAAMPLLPYGATGMVVARAAIDAIKIAKETMGLSDADVVTLDESRTALELAVNEHSKQVAARLAG